MARTDSKVTVNNFVGGLVTDYHSLNTPQNVTVDEDNCDLDRKGSRKRRLGIDYESGYEFSTNTVAVEDFPSYYLKTYEWEGVDNDVNRNFLIVQLGNILEFYDKAFDSLSPNRKSFEIDLDTYKTSASVSASSTGIQVASGKGVLFIVGKYINPLRVEYDPDTDTITVTETEIRIRDLTQLDNDSETVGFNTSEADFTNELYYDLYNQGWGMLVAGNDSSNPGAVVTEGQTALSFYRSIIGSYPPKSKPWWVGKRAAIDPGEAGFEVFDPSGVYDQVDAGNTLAPLGHFIIDPFNIDRSTALEAQQAANPLTSGSYIATDFPLVIDNTRPTAVAYHSGRVFYGHKNTVYFSQLLHEDLANMGKCYQQADPTAEGVNDLIATDGGTILIPMSGEILAFGQMENSLLILTNKGIWALGGADANAGFSATGFSVSKLTSTGITTSRTVVDVEGTPFWWAEEGIFTVQSESNKQGFQVVNICNKKVQEFYDDIPKTSLIYASGAYDCVKKVITWIFNSTSTVLHSNQFACNRCLNYDVQLGAFYPYTISNLATNSPFIVDVFPISTTLQTDVDVDVVNSADVLVVNSIGTQVVSSEASLATTTLTVGLKFLTFTPSEVPA